MLEKKIAYLGLGIMGSAMAANLARAGHATVVWNRTAGSPGEALATAAGARVGSSIADAVSDADIIFVCVSDVPDLEEVLLGKGGVAQSAKPSAIVVDMGTSGPEAARQFAKELKKVNIRFLDAPVTGGDVGAKNGTLTIMVGGDTADFEECKAAFEILGQKIFLCGPVGSGQGVKLCNQILCAVNMVALCETIQLADHLNLDRKMVVDVCSTGAGSSWALSNLGPKIAGSDFQPGFMIKHILKDLRLVDESIVDTDIELPGTNLAEKFFWIAAEIGGRAGEDQGTQAMFRAYTEKTARVG